MFTSPTYVDANHCVASYHELKDKCCSPTLSALLGTRIALSFLHPKDRQVDVRLQG